MDDNYISSEKTGERDYRSIYSRYRYKVINASISVEAAIVLSIFLIAFFTVVCIFSFVTAQVVLQNACSQLAREISEFSYIYRKVDIEELKKSDFLDGLELRDLDIKSLNFKVNDILLKNKVEKYIDDEKSDGFLRRLGVVNGLDGLNFLCTDALNEDGQMTIIIRYKMENRMQAMIKKKFDFCVSATTISLGSELKNYDYSFELYDDEKEVSDESINIWDITPYYRTDKFKKCICEDRNYVITDDRLGLDFYDKIDDELIYLHSLDTTCKSYFENNQIKQENICKKIEKYADSMIEDLKNRECVSANGELIETKRNRCKLLIIMNSETESFIEDYEKIINELEEQFRRENSDIYTEIEIEFNNGEI